LPDEPGRIAYMSTTPEVNGPMVLAWYADLDTVIPAVKALGYAGLSFRLAIRPSSTTWPVKRKIENAGLEIVAISTGPIGIEKGCTSATRSRRPQKGDRAVQDGA